MIVNAGQIILFRVRPDFLPYFIAVIAIESFDTDELMASYQELPEDEQSAKGFIEWLEAGDYIDRAPYCEWPLPFED